MRLECRKRGLSFYLGGEWLSEFCSVELGLEMTAKVLTRSEKWPLGVMHMEVQIVVWEKA
jgi:hypothetical protein